MEREGESGSHAGDTGDEERAKKPLGCGGRLKVERGRGARGGLEAMSSGWSVGRVVDRMSSVMSRDGPAIRTRRRR
jgi:hypothetical protein